MTVINQQGSRGYATGSWLHLFGIGTKETQCRVVISLDKRTLIAAQEWTEVGFVDLVGDRFRDLAASLIEVNAADLSPLDWDLEATTEMPAWATSCLAKVNASEWTPTQTHVAQENPDLDRNGVLLVAGLRTALLISKSELPATSPPGEDAGLMDLSRVDDFALIAELQRRGRLVHCWSANDFDPVLDEDQEVDELALSDKQRQTVQDLAFNEARDDLDGIVISRGNEYLSDWWAMNKQHILEHAKRASIATNSCSGT